MKRKINVPLIKQWLRDHQPQAKEKLALSAQISVSMIEKIVTYKYHSELHTHSMDAISRAMDIPVDKLFPPDNKKRKSSGYDKNYL